MPHGILGNPTARRQRIEGRKPLHEAVDCLGLEPRKLLRSRRRCGFSYGTKTNYMPRVAAADGHCRNADRAELRGQFAAAHMPSRADAKGVRNLVGTHRREAAKPHTARIGRHAVDLLDRESRVVKGLFDRITRKGQWLPGESDPNLRLTDAGDIRVVMSHFSQPS